MPEQEMRDWHKRLSEALEPQVPFDYDAGKMLMAAYKVRGDQIAFILSRMSILFDPYFTKR